MLYWKRGAFSPSFCFSITAVGPARKSDFQELIFPSINIRMQRFNVSLAHSLDMWCEWASSLDVQQNIARNTKGHLKAGEKTTMFLPGGDNGGKRPQRAGSPLQCLIRSTYYLFPETNHWHLCVKVKGSQLINMPSWVLGWCPEKPAFLSPSAFLFWNPQIHFVGIKKRPQRKILPGGPLGSLIAYWTLVSQRQLT